MKLEYYKGDVNFSERAHIAWIQSRAQTTTLSNKNGMTNFRIRAFQASISEEMNQVMLFTGIFERCL